MDIFVFIAILAGIQLFCWIVGRGSKASQSREEYFLGDRRLTFFPLMMTFLATNVGGGLLLGSAEEAYRYGILALLYPLGGALGLFFLSYTGRILARTKASTISELLETAYRSKILRKFASILLTSSLFLLLIGQFVASYKFFLSIGVYNLPLFFAFWGCIIFYIANGGFKAVISTDIILSTFFTLALFITISWIYFYKPTSFSSALFEIGNLSLAYNKWVGWLLMPLLYMLIDQEMAQRSFASNSGKTVSKAALFSAIFSFLVALVPIICGLYAKNSGFVAPKGSSIFLFTIEQLTNPTITAIVGCAILAAIISTATSILNAISSNLAFDFGILELKKARLMTSIVAFMALFLAFSIESIVDLFMLSYSLTITTLFVPILFSLFRKNPSPQAAFGSIGLGLTGFVIFQFYEPLFLQKELLNLTLSLAGYGLGSLFQLRQKTLIS